MEKNLLGIYLKDVKKNITKEDQKSEEIFLLARKDKEIFNKIVLNNLALVIKISKKYATKELPLEDLIQEGNIGLMKAIEKFDTRKKVKFSTYAMWWIKYYIFMAIFYQKRIIRLPCNKEKEINSMKRKEKELCRALGREPTILEISKYLNIEEEKLKKLNKINYNYISYDTIEMFDNENNHIGYQTEEIIEKEILQQEIEKIILGEDAYTAKIIKHLYGLMGVKKMSIVDISNELGINVVKVRQIKNAFLGMVRKKYSYLKDFI